MQLQGGIHPPLYTYSELIGSIADRSISHHSCLWMYFDGSITEFAYCEFPQAFRGEHLLLINWKIATVNSDYTLIASLKHVFN